MKPDHVSHSQLNSYLRCGKAYYLSRVAKVPRQPSVWLVAGKALHEAFEDANQAHVQGLSFDPIATWSQRFEGMIASEIEMTGTDPSTWRTGGRVSKDKPNKEDLEWWGMDGLRQLNDYLTWLRTSGFTFAEINGKHAIELETHCTFGDIEVWGFCDAIFQDPNGAYQVVDYKSGSRVPKEHQLSLYAAAMKRNFDLDIEYGSFYMTRTGKLTDPIDIRQYGPEYFDRQFSQLASALEAEIFLANPGDACYVCDVKAACYAARGHDAWKYDPDHPQFTFNKKEK